MRASAVQFYSNNILSFPSRHLLPAATSSERAWTSGVEIYISFSCSGKSNEISLNAIYLFISGTSLDPSREQERIQLPWFLSAWCSQRGWPCAGGALEETPGQLVCGQKIQGPDFGKRDQVLLRERGRTSPFTVESGEEGS